MSAAWRKLGVLYAPANAKRHPKLMSHAANPLAVPIEGNVYRIFFSGRDAQNRSSVGAVDVDIAKRQILREHEEPFFEHGPLGSFYADGVSIGNCYQSQGVRYMLFMGWQNPNSGHWRGDIGRLVVTSALGLQLDSQTPFIGVDGVDPVSLSYPWVMELGDAGYRIWYGSTLAWDAGNGEMLHVIHQASSIDGHNWHREGLAVPYELGKAQAFSRPTVRKDANDGFEMWFSYRGTRDQPYRIGYASSKNGVDWQLRLDRAGIDVSAGGWDSDMIEYPFVFEHGGERYMLYNGNGYGRSGFGLALWVES